MFYAICRRLLRAALAVFYRRIEIAGLEQVPAHGPIVFAANHTNALTDAFLIMAYVPRKISFMAKSGLFAVPVLGRLIAAAGGVPAYRAQDVGGKDRRRNLESFDQAFEVLAKGGAFALFPEGISHSEPDLQELKTGAARIVLGAEERHGFGLHAHVVPVGLTFSRKEAFRSRAFVAFGEPIPAARFAAQHREAPRPAIAALTDAIADALRGVTLTADTWDDLAAARLLAAMLERDRPADTAGGIAAQLARAREVKAAYTRLREAHPEETARLRARVLRYARKLRTLGVRDRQVGLRYTPLGVARFVVRNTLALGVTLPVAAVGAVAHVLPWVVARRIGDHPADVDVRASYAILAGLVCFPLWWIGWAVAAGLWQGPTTGAVVGAALPVAGAVALRTLDRRREAWEETRAFFRWISRPGTLARLAEDRAGILADARALGEAAGPPDSLVAPPTGPVR